MAYTSTLKVFEILREKFDETEAKVITSAVETALETNNSSLLEVIATKTDLANLRAELIKWMFIFWVGQFASITAILFVFFK